jgi:hypothetical protein
MPIIHNYSDKHKLKIVLLASLYILIPVGAVAVLFSVLTTPKTAQQTTSETETRYICFEKDVEQYLVDKVEIWAVDHTEYLITDPELVDECNVLVERNSSDPNDLDKLFDTTYVLVRREGGTLSNITQQQLLDSLISQTLGDYTLIWNPDTDSFLRSNFNIGVGQVVHTEAEVSKILKGDSLTAAVIRMKEVEDDLRVIKIDNQSPQLQAFNGSRYPLIDRYWIGGTSEEDIELLYAILMEETAGE